MNFFSILSAPFTIFFFTTITVAIHDHEFLTGDVSINCGSTENFAADGREWIGDGHKKVSSSVQIKGSSTSSSIAGGSIVSADQAQYKTARISRSKFSYIFHLIPGPKLIRLHFNPVSYRGFKGVKDLFTVEAGPFILLGNFSASQTAEALGGNGESIAKEFCIKIEENQPLDIIFYPADRSIQSQDGALAFVNGIEIISIPTHLSYFRSGVQVVNLKSLVHIYNHNHTAFEIIHRQNVKPSDGFVNMSKSRINKPNNFAWKISVDVGFRYLVRIHLCELGLKIAKETHMIFQILINEIRVDDNILLVEKRDDNEFLQYRDYMTTIQGRKQDGKHNLLISIESTDELMDRCAPFKGFEILKLCNFDNSLASPNPHPPKRDSPYQTVQNLLKVCGARNTILNAAITIFALVNIVVYKLRQLWEDNFVEEEKEPSAMVRPLCRRFSLTEIKAATQNFNHAFVIGNGGFSKVYIGIINNGEEIVAIRRLKYNSKQGAHEFWMEIETLSELRHANLVSLIGYCNEQKEMILVYEYMVQGTLVDRLFKQATSNNHSSSLTWSQCLSICIGAGQGLDYLHTSRGIIHGDVKISNILLDENFVAKLSYSGLTKPENIWELQSHVSTNVSRTYGYFDPYYISSRSLTRKSDIYAFGVVLLEVLCGRLAVDPRLEEDQHSLATWALENISKGDAEKIISSNIRGEILPDSLTAFVRVVECCLDDEPKNRPTMAQVLLQLELVLYLQEKPNFLVSKETGTAAGSPRNTFFKSAKLSQKKDWEESSEDYTTEAKVGEIDWVTIEAATDRFSDLRIIGEGRGCIFYKGVLYTRQVVLVKRTKLSWFRPTVSKREINHLSKYKHPHPNIMKLLGNFTRGKDGILVYEFMEKYTSLHALLFERCDQLPWTLSFKLIIGIARGLLFLHQKEDLRTIYSKLEPCNIFLDIGMNPKIAIDYCSPTHLSEYAPPQGYQAKHKYASDIYSFGVIVLEIISGMKHSSFEEHKNLIKLAWQLQDEGNMLELVRNKIGIGFSSEEATICIKIALLCTELEPQDRPDISVVLAALQGDGELEKELILANFRFRLRLLDDFFQRSIAEMQNYSTF